jgi:hypothetical protein
MNASEVLATAELGKTAELLGAPIRKALPGKAQSRTTAHTQRAALDSLVQSHRKMPCDDCDSSEAAKK